MDFFDKTGKMAIGSRLRMLTDTVTADASRIYNYMALTSNRNGFHCFLY